MTYCTIDELQKTTGTSLAEIVLQEIIEEAERDVDVILAPFDLVGSTASAPKNAALNFAKAGILQRMFIDGTQPENVQASGVLGMIKRYEDKAKSILAEFVRDDTTGVRPMVRSVHG